MFAGGENIGPTFWSTLYHIINLDFANIPSGMGRNSILAATCDSPGAGAASEDVSENVEQDDETEPDLNYYTQGIPLNGDRSRRSTGSCIQGLNERRWLAACVGIFNYDFRGCQVNCVTEFHIGTLSSNRITN